MKLKFLELAHGDWFWHNGLPAIKTDDPSFTKAISMISGRTVTLSLNDEVKMIEKPDWAK